MTKLVGTQLVTEASVTDRLPGTVLRAFNVVGPEAPATSLPGRVAAELHRGMRSGSGVRLGRLDTVRDFVDVRDVARAAVLAAVCTGQLPEILNIGRGEPVVVRRLVQEVARAAEFSGEIHEDGTIPDRSSVVEWQCADIQRSRQVLGWKPSVTLRRSVADLWQSTIGAGPARWR